jgi:hypothetical protein
MPVSCNADDRSVKGQFSAGKCGRRLVLVFETCIAGGDSQYARPTAMGTLFRNSMGVAVTLKNRCDGGGWRGRIRSGRSRLVDSMLFFDTIKGGDHSRYLEAFVS